MDAKIVTWVGGLGAAGAEHVMERFGMGRSWAYARLNRLTADGLLEQRVLLHRHPGLYVATADGLRWTGLEYLGVSRVRPAGFEHAWQVASAAVSLERRLGGWQVWGERELRAEEAAAGELIATASLGELPGGQQMVHRPDLALLSPAGRVVAVEVELSVKAPRRLAAICRGWARARHVDRVYYLAAPAAARALGRAVGEARAEDRVEVLRVGQAHVIVGAELEGIEVRS